MTQHVLLNNIDHQHTRVIHHFGFDYGDNLASTLVFPTEFNELQKEYPILARRDEASGQFQAIVLMGFAADENLYLAAERPSGWDARYIPATIEKGPFLIGFSRNSGQGDAAEDPMVHIDLDHPKVISNQSSNRSNQESNQANQGQPLFLPEGGNSPYLLHISATLQAIHQGIALSSVMFSAFEQLALLEPVTIEFSLQNGDKRRLIGNYCIDQNRLAALRGADLEKLHQSGFLQLAHAMVSSMSNIRDLIERKNRRLALSTDL
ncbi:hypothetical protein EOE67_17320 [Rheinheimera riviphila]|uniref:Peptide ABC transporter permease n=1 Tax=Rheinheimera riviphila TaxID=1834037 RepID=A0A437QFN6_9GAMM|nr:SapC family protein [Rheinheimera riviphila]RVU33355.1 hypothetical protein EOE67_17320 [Rheinheimera riviphila]